MAKSGSRKAGKVCPAPQQERATKGTRKNGARASADEGFGVTASVLTWADDPASGFPPLVVGAPNLAGGRLPIRILDPAPPPREYLTGTAEFRYWAAGAALSRGVDFWAGVLPPGASWRTGPTLPVRLDRTQFIGGRYLRQGGLEFYHETAAGRTVFGCESPDLVCHELGHAVLDSIRPEIYHVPAFEQAAFHEAFGDISALLCSLQVPQVRAAVLAETDGRLRRDSRVSRFAESIGWVQHQKNPSLSSDRYLRNAANEFTYQPPTSRPTGGPHTDLTSQPHNFCRVFTGAFLDMLDGLLHVVSQQPQERDLAEASELSARILVLAVISAPITSAYFAQVAGHMVGHAGRVSASPPLRDQLVAAVSSAYVRRGILSNQSAFGAGALSSMLDGHAAADDGELPTISVQGGLFGLAERGLRVRAPVQGDGRIDVRATGVNAEESPAVSGEETVHRFLEFLLSRGQLDLGEFGGGTVGLTHPQIYKTHTVIAGKEGVYLKRLGFGCGFDDVCLY
jgi:hypothetical protein